MGGRPQGWRRALEAAACGLGATLLGAAIVAGAMVPAPASSGAPGWVTVWRPTTHAAGRDDGVTTTWRTAPFAAQGTTLQVKGSCSSSARAVLWMKVYSASTGRRLAVSEHDAVCDGGTRTLTVPRTVAGETYYVVYAVHGPSTQVTGRVQSRVG